MSKELPPLSTTVVGSFPLENTEQNMVRAFDDEINMGLDYPCYPQLVPMISQFLTPLSEKIEEVEMEGDTYYLGDDFRVPTEPVATQYGKFMINFLQERPYLKELIKGTKACLTGPFTLASEILLKNNLGKDVKPFIFKEPRAVMVDWIVEKIATIMKKIGEAYNEMGINIISMDEPILSLLIGRKPSFHNEDFYVDTLNQALSGISVNSSIHVCGRISPKLKNILLKTDVTIVDHEFRTNEDNFDVYTRKDLEQNDKLLALGAIETYVKKTSDLQVKDYVESVENVKKFIQRGIDLYGKKNLLIKPDCGFRSLKDLFGEKIAYEISIRKLNNMVLAVKELR